MLEIEYAPDGEAVNDFQALTRAEEMAEAPGRYKVSTSNIVHALRRMVARCELNDDDICFYWNGRRFDVNRFGAGIGWPNGFADLDLQMAEDILRCAAARKRQEHNMNLNWG
jgi:hypothetical protein